MHEITEQDIAERMRLDNPWWDSDNISSTIFGYRRRDYFKAIFYRVRQTEPRRALVLMGPRRVGKTVLLQHVIGSLINGGASARNIFYISLDTPVYIKMSLEKLLGIFLREIASHSDDETIYVFFDEVQYLKDWEVHLKSLVDTDAYRNIKFTVSGSAAAALRMKSHESGAGRFTNILLPPLTFAEYLGFMGLENNLIIKDDMAVSGAFKYQSPDINKLNEAFVNYLNYGGYPEVALSEATRKNLEQFVRSDIIDKVLLRDLPSLYGISDLPELNSLFMMLAYNSGGEVTLEALSKKANISKQTIKRYLEYLESAFLIRKVERIDRNAKHFKRMTSAKFYLTNPSLRAALFGPVDSDDNELMGLLAETAAFSQWYDGYSTTDEITYARWSNGEVDMVNVDKKTLKPRWVSEIKWSDHFFQRPGSLTALLDFSKKHEEHIVEGIGSTTKTKSGKKTAKGIEIEFIPTSLYCYMVAKNQVRHIVKMLDLEDEQLSFPLD